MATFCLVHGSTQSAAGWDLLVGALERRGHRCIAPTLPADTPNASATHYADEIAKTLPEHAPDIIVVAHSASGLFLPLVPARHQVQHLVFLAAVIPKLGVSLLDQIRAEPEMMNPDWVGRNPMASDEIALRFLFHDCSPAVAQWALTTRRLMHAQRAYDEVCPLEQWPTVPSTCVVCRDDRTVSPTWSTATARERLGVEPIELAAGHCPHVSRPSELAEILVSIVL